MLTFERNILYWDRMMFFPRKIAADGRASKQLTSRAFSIDNHSGESGPTNAIRVLRAFAIPDAIINRDSPLCINIIRSVRLCCCCCYYCTKPFHNPSEQTARSPFRLYISPSSAEPSGTDPPILLSLCCRNNTINPACCMMTRPKTRLKNCCEGVERLSRFNRYQSNRALIDSIRYRR